MGRDIEADQNNVGGRIQVRRLLITMENTFKARDVVLQYGRYKAQHRLCNFVVSLDRTPYEQQIAKDTQRRIKVLRQKGVDARYRDVGKIAIFKDRRFEKFLEQENWPQVEETGMESNDGWAGATSYTATGHRIGNAMGNGGEGAATGNMGRQKEGGAMEGVTEDMTGNFIAEEPTESQLDQEVMDNSEKEQARTDEVNSQAVGRRKRSRDGSPRKGYTKLARRLSPTPAAIGWENGEFDEVLDNRHF